MNMHNPSFPTDGDQADGGQAFNQAAMPGARAIRFQIAGFRVIRQAGGSIAQVIHAIVQESGTEAAAFPTAAKDGANSRVLIHQGERLSDSQIYDGVMDDRTGAIHEVRGAGMAAAGWLRTPDFPAFMEKCNEMSPCAPAPAVVIVVPRHEGRLHVI
ncbi:MAG: hypothetical protein H6865_03250 [Rhodospirillales bacterium]|nr:hypothetical protein [Alphaproteobacteria bacterium]MCB9986635.1 hypothetical protein [Rhodospirillales bacterium]USO06836.1 MAG: hypothetical protein H6866_05135 [Rhodospirillales bacterium]